MYRQMPFAAVVMLLEMQTCTTNEVSQNFD